MVIDACPTCDDSGIAQTGKNTRDGRVAMTKCWCSFENAAALDGQTVGLYWLNEVPAGKITAIAKEYLASREEFSPDELNRLKWYVGQWTLGVLEEARRSFPPHRFADCQLKLYRWKQRIAEVEDRKGLNVVVDWLDDLGLSPF